MTTKTKNEAAPYGHDRWYVAAFVVAVLLLAASAYVAHQHTVTGVELKVFRHINDWPNKLTTFFKVCSIAPESVTFGAVAVVLAFVLRYYRLSWRLAIEVLAGGAITELLKLVIARPRPFTILSDVHVRWQDAGNGFPSGHAMMITVIMITILPYLPKLWRWIVVVPIALVGLSRVYLGLHAPLDVVGGFAVGLGVVSFIRILPQSLKVALRLD